MVAEERGGIEILSFKTTKFYGGATIPDGQFQISIVPEWATGNNDDVAEWCRKQLVQYRNSAAATVDILRRQATTIGGAPAYVIDSKVEYKEVDDGGESDRQVCIAKGDTKIGIIGRPLESQYLPVFDQILSTFAFMD